LSWVFVEAGLQAGQADLKVGLYMNRSLKAEETCCQTDLKVGL
jgi:hypothetical protein